MSNLLSDFDFELPEELIAQRPTEQRSDARLLVVRRNPRAGEPALEDLTMRDLPALVDREPRLKGSVWFRNRSKVFPARFYAQRSSGSRHEVVLIEALNPERTRWKALLRNSRRFHYPETLLVTAAMGEYRIGVPEEGVVDLTGFGLDPLKTLEDIGEMPLPPYIRERDARRDRERYQSLWARSEFLGSAAAPTASLHFDEGLITEMERRVQFQDLILHVGLGTFEALRENEIAKNTLHAESLQIPSASAKLLAQPRHPPFVAVGTTALRTMESFALREGESLVRLKETADGSYVGNTQIFIRPGFAFKNTQVLLTNFHLPRSSLLILLASFAGSRERVLEVYQHAIRHRYRFFSYGDASIWI